MKPYKIFSGVLLFLLATPLAAEPKTTIVFFSEWSANLEPAAQDAVKHAAELAKAGKDTPVTVTGYADTTGSDEANNLLSATRAQIVTDELIKDGVSKAFIKQEAKGATETTGIKQASRRVSIAVGD